jgi:hypothetical protein
MVRFGKKPSPRRSRPDQFGEEKDREASDVPFAAFEATAYGMVVRYAPCPKRSPNLEPFGRLKPGHGLLHWFNDVSRPSVRIWGMRAETGMWLVVEVARIGIWL